MTLSGCYITLYVINSRRLRIWWHTFISLAATKRQSLYSWCHVFITYNVNMTTMILKIKYLGLTNIARSFVLSQTERKSAPVQKPPMGKLMTLSGCYISLYVINSRQLRISWHTFISLRSKGNLCIVDVMCLLHIMLTF